MRAVALIVLSLAALAYAGPFSKSTDNQVEADMGQQRQLMGADIKQTESVELLKQWCFASQMSQPELTASFKKLVGIVKSSPEDQHTEGAVLSERICQGAIVQTSAHGGQTEAGKGADAQAHELIKDVYMDALISCDKRECMKQLVKIIDSKQVEPIRAAYYMTRLAVAEQATVKDEADVKQLAESFVGQREQRDQSELIERQKLFAITAMLAKVANNKQQVSAELKQITDQVAKTIVERYIKSVGPAELQQFIEQTPSQQSEQVAKKIAKRSAALKALANIPGWMLKQTSGIEEVLTEIATSKVEQSSARQSAIECLEQNESALKVLKQLCFAQEEPIEVRVAAYRALMSVAFASDMAKDEQAKQQIAAEIVADVLKHCEEQRNQQTDDQFCLYCISHLDNLRSSQQPEHKCIKEVIAKNKQHYMQIHLLVNKFKQQLQDVRRSSRNYKLEQQFGQIQSGLIIEGDIVYDSKHSQAAQTLPKMVRVNMSMPVMGETVNVLELTVRQSHMDEELLGALKLVSKFNKESVAKVVDQFKSSVEKQSQTGKSAEADLTVKVEGCTVIYVCVDDFKTGAGAHQRTTRSVYSLVDEIIERLKRKPVAFNRGFNLNMNERLAKVLDVDANLVAGLRFESRASGQSATDFEVAAEIEPRLALEAIVGPAKLSTKKLLQRFSTKSALGLRLRYKSNELVDVQVDLPMSSMDLFTVESQLVEKSAQAAHSYTYLPESVYGQQDIYLQQDGYDQQDIRKVKRSIFERAPIAKVFKGKSGVFAHTYETSERVARATGLRAQVRVAVAPKDAGFMLKVSCQKYEPQMEGYRVQVQRSQRGAEQQQYTVTVSTPGARTERTMQLRLTKQAGSQRTLVKADIQAATMGASLQCELVHDGRQYAVKAELASTRGPQWRHVAEVGVQRGSQSQSGRIATTYKPFVTIDSTHLRRPVQLQGALSYLQSAKSVIAYELKCAQSGDFVQGKIILDAQRPAYLGKRQAVHMRRSPSPVELVLEKEVTLTGELVAQVRQQALKVHQMFEWSPSKVALKAELSCAHEDKRRAQQTQIVGQLKVDAEQQMLSVERKCPQDGRKQFRLSVVSDMQSAGAHQLVCELRYSGKRAANQVLAYKHKVELAQVAPKKAEVAFSVELVDSQRQVNDKFVGRAQLAIERSMKSLKGELAGRDKQVKVELEFASLAEHQMELVFQAPRVQHRCSVRADQRQFAVQSRTDKDGQMLAKVAVSLLKQQAEGQLLVEVPSKGAHAAFDVKLAPGKLSSMAVQTRKFSSKAEFSFDKMRAGGKLGAIFGKQFGANYRLKGDLKDLAKRESYWLESGMGADLEQASFLRVDSPVYRAELEFDPRDQSAKFGAFARAKRSANFEQLYSAEDSIVGRLGDKLRLADKLWAVRSVISAPAKVDELKHKAVRALLEFADRDQQHQHSLDWTPTEGRVKLAFERQPSAHFAGATTFKPARLTGDLYADRPSRLALESDFADAELELQPFDGQQTFARLSALSRHPRSPFSKHDSELSYTKAKGYKAWMKHQDKQHKRHTVHLESDAAPNKWAKIAYDSDKLGKGQWEHKWRKHAERRQHPVRGDEQIYANRVTFKTEAPKSADWTHQTELQWDEPAQHWARVRRSATPEDERPYGPIDYLKHVNARASSTSSKQGAQLYKLDFDYQPDGRRAALTVDMPDQMLHSSVLEFEPTERLYKVQSKLYNTRTGQAAYELAAATKPLDQDAFMAASHPMYEGPIDGRRLASKLLAQPIQLDYSDRQGRLARLDYDLAPLSGAKYAGLRQKRAALYYKDAAADLEHDSKLDFYPEALLTSFKPAKRVPADVAFKTHTKFGPIVVHADSADDTLQLELSSPVCSAKLTGETAPRGAHLIKVQLDNKQQRVQLAKLLRNTPLLAQLAKKLDACRFEHQSELLASPVDAIFKVKSHTKVDERQVLAVEGELDGRQQKAIVKVDGKRAKGQAVIDIARQTGDIVIDIDDKRTLQHQTRVQRVANNFYSMDSMTSYKQQPLIKLSSKISGQVFSQPMHLFTSGRMGAATEGHISTFEATIYQPKVMLVRGQYDCIKKEARVVIENKTDKRVQQTDIKFDERTQSIIVDSRLTSPQGPIYQTEAKIGLAGLKRSYECKQQAQTCNSDVFYQDKSGVWAAKYFAGDKIAFSTPMGKQTLKLVY